MQEILSSFEITDDYYWTLSIAPETDYEIHLRASPGSCFFKTITQFCLRRNEAKRSEIRY